MWTCLFACCFLGHVRCCGALKVKVRSKVIYRKGGRSVSHVRASGRVEAISVAHEPWLSPASCML